MSTSKQYLNKVKLERDDAKATASYFESRLSEERANARSNNEVWSKRLTDTQIVFEQRTATLVAQIDQERQTTRLLNAERERAKFAEDRRFDALMNTVVATAVATAQNKYPNPSGGGVDQSAKAEPPKAYQDSYVDRPVQIGRAR